MTYCILNYQIITKHLMDHKYCWFLIFRSYFILFMWVTQEEIWLASYHLSITLRESERVNVATRVISAVGDAFSKCTFQFSFQFSIELQKILSNKICPEIWINYIVYSNSLSLSLWIKLGHFPVRFALSSCFFPLQFVVQCMQLPTLPMTIATELEMIHCISHEFGGQNISR